ncbi:MAG: type II secretion system F family protein [Brevundimonas sp.]|nr:MAG: type II secretion system F family protein [Brevundimonas sp.]
MLPILAAVLAFITIGGLGWAFVGGGDSSDVALKRAEGFGGPKQSASAARKAAASTPEARRKQIMLQLQEADRAERKARVSLKAKLKHAGLSMSVTVFCIISIVLGFVAFLIPLVFGMNIFICLGVGIIVGLGLPRWVVGFLAKGRMKKFSSHFADAVDIIVRGVKTGLPVHDCLKIIARESPAPLGPEFQRLVEGLGVGLTMAQALDKMYDRMPTPELKFFSIVMAIQAKTGGNLAEALGNLSAVLRGRKLMVEKIKALSSEAIASAGIIGSMPPLVMAAVGFTTPSYMARMFTDPRGQFMLIVAVLTMSLGIFVMKKMIAFKF